MNDIETKIINKYIKEKKSASNVAKELNIKMHYVYYTLRKNNINRRSLSNSHIVHSFDRNFFSKIDTEEKAYFLGFLYADGNVHRNAMQICLQPRDEVILIKLKDCLKATHKITNDRGYKRFTITSEDFVNQLENLGCHRQKTFSIRFPNNNIVPNHLIRHFIRGYFDGDGCITYSIYKKENNRIRWALQIISNYDFLLKFQEIFAKKCDLNIYPLVHEKRSNRPIYYMRYCGSTNKNLLKIFDYLYSDSAIYLKRKYNKFIEINNKILENIELRKI